MRFHPRRAVLPMLLATMAGCASTGTQVGETENFRTITEDQIVRHTATNALDLVNAVRPGWLQKRGARSIHFDGDLVVYFGNVRFGGPSSLRSISLDEVVSIEYFDGPSATQRWGTGHSHGAIVVHTRG